MEVGGDGKRPAASRSQICVLSAVSQNAPKCLKVSQRVPKCLSREFSRGWKFKICGSSAESSTAHLSLTCHSFTFFTSLPCLLFKASRNLWNCDTSTFLTDCYIDCIHFSFTGQNFSACLILRGRHITNLIISHIYVWASSLWVVETSL